MTGIDSDAAINSTAKKSPLATSGAFGSVLTFVSMKDFVSYRPRCPHGWAKDLSIAAHRA